jgi:alcohol dehydrogenase
VRQLNYIRANRLEWHDVPEPSLQSDTGALVRPLAVTTCDMDGFVISGLAAFRGPVPVGHEGVGEVVEIGAGVTQVKPGDRVIIPWKISCGSCVNCDRGFTAHCRSVPREAAYSWGPTAREHGAFLADLVHVPWADHMLCPLPDGTTPITGAGLSDNIVQAWDAVGPPLEQRPGGRVLVAGGGGPGSIGVWAASLAVVLGAGEVTLLDSDPDRRVLAERYGVDRVIDTPERLPEGEGTFDVTVDAAGDPEALRLVLLHTAANGICTSTAGAVYVADVPIPALEMWRQSVTFRTGWVHTRALMQKPLELVAGGRFDPTVTFTAVVPFDQAADRLAEPFTKLGFLA